MKLYLTVHKVQILISFEKITRNNFNNFILARGFKFNVILSCFLKTGTVYNTVIFPLDKNKIECRCTSVFNCNSQG